MLCVWLLSEHTAYTSDHMLPNVPCLERNVQHDTAAALGNTTDKKHTLPAPVLVAQCLSHL